MVYISISHVFYVMYGMCSIHTSPTSNTTKNSQISSKASSIRVSNCHEFSNLHILNSIQIMDIHLISPKKARYFTAKTSNYLKITHLHISSP